MSSIKNMNKAIKILLILFIIIIVILAGIELYFLHNKTEQLTNSIVGTYQTDLSGQDSTYLVFTNEKKFVYYRQFKLFYKGRYEQEKYDTRIYTLKDNNGKVKGQVLLFGKSLYFLKGGSYKYIKFTKTDNEPMYINLKNR